LCFNIIEIKKISHCRVYSVDNSFVVNIGNGKKLVSAKGEGIQSFLNKSLCETNKICKGFPFGHLFATNDVGISHLLHRSDTEAVKCFEVSANGGNVIAMYNLAACYIRGIGGKVDLPQSRYWLQFAAEYEYPPAQSLHGHNLFDASPSTSLDLIRRAAKNGYFCTCDQCTEKVKESNQKEIPIIKCCIMEAIRKKICTFTVTNGREETQPKFECGECGLRGKFGFCSSCKDVCHSGHQDVSKEAIYKPFTCHCGSSNWCSCVPATPAKCIPKHSLLIREIALPKQAC